MTFPPQKEYAITSQPLPLLDDSRSEFGFCRTVCSCAECTRCCRLMPGYLVPADLDRIHQHLKAEEDVTTWARSHLLASPGALVMRGYKVFRIPTLVPARRPDGSCTFLTTDGLCGIHAVAPYGCAFFDSHMGAVEADRRSGQGLRAVLQAWLAGGAYAQVWAALFEAGLKAPAPEDCRRQLKQATEEESRG
jgi:Fe-S-cluster containining protein